MRDARAPVPPTYQSTVDALPDMALLYTAAGELLHANPAGLAGLARLGLLPPDGGLTDVDLVSGVADQDREPLRAALRQALRGAPGPALRLSMVEPAGLAPDGPAAPARVVATGAVVFNPIRLDEGPAHLQVLIRDVSERVAAEQALATSEGRLRAMFDHSPVGVAVVVDGRFDLVNPAMCRILGRSPDELIGLTADDVTHPEDLEQNLQVRDALNGGAIVRVVKRYLRPDGSALVGELVAARTTDTGSTQTVVQLRDVTYERTAHERLEHLATHDALTGLPNRMLASDRLDHALAARPEQRRLLAVLFVDLDGFKQINDGLSHQVGDRVLEVTAHRLRDAVRPGDTVARWGGDEFVVILTDLAGEDEAVAVVQRIERAIAAPIPHRSDELFLTASVGIAYAEPDDTLSAGQLLTGADAAMYRAKKSRTRHSVFDQALRDVAGRRGHVEHVLRTAVAAERVVLHYQPVVELRSRRIVGAEALLRLRDDDGTLLYPDAFLDVAEATGLMVRIEHAVLELACEQGAAWARFGSDLSMSVNVCAAQVGAIDDFEATVAKQLAQSGLAPARLRCELTEHALLDLTRATLDGLERMSATGVGFSVDDFGTGYASMTYLDELPLSEIKIDRRFVAKAGLNRKAAAIVRAVAGLAADLDMRCVAEGIETEAAHALALRLGATIGQGYLYARPVPARQLTALLEQGLAL